MFRIVRAFLVSSWWLWLAAIAFAIGYVSAARAAHPEEMKIKRALDDNFEAYNNEDVKKMMATLSPTIPRREEFKAQASKLFKDTDSYISVRDFELLAVRGQYATARVVQATMPRKDAPEPTAEEAFYREHSKLLPGEEETEYVQSFKKEGGKWRLWLIMPMPRQPAGGYCRDGNCSFPRSRVSGR